MGARNQIVPVLTQGPNQPSPYVTTQTIPGAATALSGALTDASGQPVRSAEIHLIGRNGELVARTAADGSFAFPEVPSGDYEVAVVLGGREVAYQRALHLGTISAPSRLTLSSGGHLLISGARR